MFIQVTGLLVLSLYVGNSYYPRITPDFPAPYQRKSGCFGQTGEPGFVPLF